jgi:RNA polymerase sigma-70 factor (ECF subfamily)
MELIGQISSGEVVAALEKFVQVIPGRMDGIAAVYDECLPELFGYAASLTGDRTAAEDVVQEAFARLVTQTAGGRGPENARAWLYTVTTNLAFSRARRRAVADRWNQLFGRVARDETGEAADVAVLRSERNAELGTALRTLPKDHRAALLLAADGFTGREIAGILARSEGATRNILWRARLALRDRLEAGDTE